MRCQVCNNPVRADEPTGLCWRHRSISPSATAPALPPPRLVPGSTPVDSEEAQYLLDGITVTTRAELDDLEAEGFEDAVEEYLDDPHWCLDHIEVRKFHQIAFGKIWSWAGQYRKVDTSIGIDPSQIQTQLYQLLEDARYRLTEEIGTAMERSVWLHHRFVQIHPFRNGNGRMSRLHSQAYLDLGTENAVLNWSVRTLCDPRQRRDSYVSALRQADSGDLSHLVKFATRP